MNYTYSHKISEGATPFHC